ncbi:hypothetical protein HBA53_23375 (plasmid) [Rhodococcus pyridinivorans]|uniref:hypothetical protein n=1 Tax=Rhodococcus TaxID=1827 RepID=UPI001C2FC4AE|nr:MULTISPECIES: hypothetical protein [Rhodococcus]MBX4171251.1 hypothetical protein [Rhodococcus sp. DMU2021]QXF84062.1 hypothetical protein HBA53_23375 [Rhodococcus pyridinivorans]
MSTRPGPRTITTVTLLALTVASCSSTDSDTSTVEDLRGNTVSALDFPRTVFDGWEITDPAGRPVSVIPAIVTAAGTSDGLVYSPAECGPDGDRGAALWATARGGDSWAGQVGENLDTEQSFTTTVAATTDNSLNAVTDFAQTCSQYTVTVGEKTVDVVTEVNNEEPLKYGLSDARLFTTTATLSGSESVHSTLTGVSHSDDRVLIGQFTTTGRIDGPTINVAGNWWNIVATKATSATN